MRNRVMLSGSWPVKFCPPSSLQECTFPVRMDRTKKGRGERSHMRVMLPMQRRSPKATGTVPTSCGDALAEADEPALLGAVIAHPVDVQEAQLQVQGTPESVSKTTESEAPVATPSEAGEPRRKEWSRRKKSATLLHAPMTVGVDVGNAVVGSAVGTRVGDGVGAGVAVTRQTSCLSAAAPPVACSLKYTKVAQAAMT